ncbi:splicing regulator SDE2 [Cylas formicarius]|uniref:splicing regulator SDE2 n=1 Tax=Cylas formicarius TaxID=197179 RepID=UPI0029584E5C|nr:splicing regulator SDE2 [Cylas formicarius]
MKLLKNNRICLDNQTNGINFHDLSHLILQTLEIRPDQYYLVCNGKIIRDGHIDSTQTLYIYPRVLGGKGGFGSMLRAIGAQIEKTTNREACRDLSGRRLRDINEEQRLKNWISQQAEREKEAKERKKKKLEKLLENPKHEFKDDNYDKERSSLPEKVEDAVLKGLEASASSSVKRKHETQDGPKKKRKLWVDTELDEDLSSSGSEDEEEYKRETSEIQDSASGQDITIATHSSDTEPKSGNSSNAP